MSTILADSSVWIELFRKSDSAPSQQLKSLLRTDQVCTTGLVIAEILSGARNESEYEFLRMSLNVIPRADEPTDCWEQVGRTRFLLARKGLKISIPDTLLTVIAISNRKALFTLDKIFKNIAKHLPLKLLDLLGRR